MKYGLHVSQCGDYADIPTLVALARAAEQSGWDGFFLWDHITMAQPLPVADPWIALSAIAVQTNQIRIGPLVTPLARRHPWKVARETVALDRLSQGRLTLGVGLGDLPQEFEELGEPADLKVRAARLEEGLAVVIRLWSGQPFQYSGTQYHIRHAQFLPTPFQQPRIPIWVAGFWPRQAPLRRAAHWDGVVAGSLHSAADQPMAVEDVRAMTAFLSTCRTSSAPFDIVVGGTTAGLDRAELQARFTAYSQLGVTWWLEHIHQWLGSLDEMRQRIQQGPPGAAARARRRPTSRGRFRWLHP